MLAEIKVTILFHFSYLKTIICLCHINFSIVPVILFFLTIWSHLNIFTTFHTFKIFSNSGIEKACNSLVHTSFEPET